MYNINIYFEVALFYIGVKFIIITIQNLRITQKAETALKVSAFYFLSA
jgi:hypothetical protein